MSNPNPLTLTIQRLTSVCFTNHLSFLQILYLFAQCVVSGCGQHPSSLSLIPHSPSPACVPLPISPSRNSVSLPTLLPHVQGMAPPLQPPHLIFSPHDQSMICRLCMPLPPPPLSWVRFFTVEHLLSALEGCAVDNARIEVEGGEEMPIIDGSSLGWTIQIQVAGLRPAPQSPANPDPIVKVLSSPP